VILFNNLRLERLISTVPGHFRGTVDSLKHQQMKSNLTKEYKKRVRKLLHSKLTSKNLILAINTYAVPLLGGIVKWTQAELKHLDVCTRKFLTMFGGFSRNGDVDCLYTVCA